MKYIKIVAFLLCVVSLSACKIDEVGGPKLTDIISNNGAYMRTIVVSSPAYTVANLGGSTFTITVEAWDAQQGALFSTYDLTVLFRDNTPTNGSKTTTQVTLKSIPASAFTRYAATNLLRATFSVTATEAMNILKLTAADVSVGDAFEISATMKLTDGRSFSRANTDNDTLSGAFFNSPFFYNVPVR